ncbi:MAG: hypothetical protein JW850_14415 [Thermoflexales bacterium]|nr:hypothetical protein [Thermoflexales bacterium]
MNKPQIQTREADGELDRLEALALKSRATSSLQSLFKLYASSGQLERAEQTCRTLLDARLSKGQLYALYAGMARVYHASHRFRHSLDALDKAIAVNSSNREAFDLLLDIHESSGSLPQAVEALQRYIAQQPDVATLAILYSVLAKTYEKMGWWVEARHTARQAIDLKPSMAEAQHVSRRADNQLKANPGFFREAATRQEKTGGIEGSWQLWLAWAQATQQADDFVTVGELCEQHDQLGKAEHAFNQAINLQRDHERAREGLHRVQGKKRLPPFPLDRQRYNFAELTQLFDWFLQCDDAAGAVDFLRRYLDRHSFVPAFQLLARAYKEIGRLGDAVQALRQAIDASFDAAKPDLYCQLGEVYAAMGQASEAIRAFRSAIQYAPHHHHLQAMRRLEDLADSAVPHPSEIHREWEDFRATGRYQEAIEQFQAYADRDLYNPHPHIYMAYAYKDSGQIDQAYEAHKHAAYIFCDANAFIKLGEFCIQTGLYAQAVEAFELALEYDPRSTEARRRLAQIPKWQSSNNQRLESRTGMPDHQYLYAVWDVAKQAGQISDAVRYLATLADVMVDDPVVFSLLGQAQEACGEFRAAAAAYWHAADLKGSFKDFAKLGDFCFRQAIDTQSVEAYRSALALNPFYYHAQARLAKLRPSRFSNATLVTGEEYCEERACKLCEMPGDQAEAKALYIGFVRNRRVKHAQATYRLLQQFHPGQPSFALDLARLCLECGQPQLAWFEAVQALATAAGPARSSLESLARQAEEEMARLGQERPSFPVEAAFSIENIAPTIATEWYMYTLPAPGPGDTSSPAALLQLAQDYCSQARRASTNDVAQIQCFLAAATVYKRAGQTGQVIDSLVSYGQAMTDYHRARGKNGLARTFADEAFRLATSDTGRLQPATLVSYILDYVDSLEQKFGTLQAWPPAVRSELESLLDAGRSRAARPVQNLVDLLGSFFNTFRSPLVNDLFQGPLHRAAVVRRRLGTVLRRQEQERLQAALKRWIDHPAPQASEAPERASLELSLPAWVSHEGGNELELDVTICNTSETPADCVWVTVALPGGQKDQQFVPFLPGRHAQAASFHLDGLQESAGYVELEAKLKYFDPTDRQQIVVRYVLTLRRPDARYEAVDNPYPVWAPSRPFVPEYLNKEHAQRLLVERAERVAVKWTPEALNQAIDITGGEAVTLETLGHYVINRLNQVERMPRDILFHDVERVVEGLVSQRDICAHFVAITESDQLASEDKLILACLAQAGDVAGWVHGDVLRQSLEGWGGGHLASDELSLWIHRLQTVMSLIQVEETLDIGYRYRLRIDLLHTWCYRHWLPSYALAKLRQAQRQERAKLAGKLQEGLAAAQAAFHVCQEAKEEHDKGLVDVGQFTKLTNTYMSKRNALLFEVKNLLTRQEYAQAHELIDMVTTNQAGHTIREALMLAAQQRGWDETQMVQRIGEGQDILGQVAHFILDIWEG